MKIILYGALADLAKQNVICIGRMENVGRLRYKILEDFPSFSIYNFQVVVNRCKANDEVCLHEQDEIALLPPFAGG